MKMNRLDELLRKNPDFGRLRDVSCQLMLADRQQEELFNYVAGFVYNFLKESGPYYRYTVDGGVPTYIREVARYNYEPVVKQVFPCQGTSVVSLGQSSQMGGDLIPDLFVLGEYNRLRKQIGGNCLFFGFVSDFLFTGDIMFRLGGNDAEIYTISQFVKPYSWFGDFQNYQGLFQKLTDTSPLVTNDGIIKADLFNSEFYQGLAAMRQLRGNAAVGGGVPEIRALPRFGVSFNFVGLAVVFGSRPVIPSPVAVPFFGGVPTPSDNGGDTTPPDNGGDSTPSDNGGGSELGGNGSLLDSNKGKDLWDDLDIDPFSGIKPMPDPNKGEIVAP